MRQFLIFSNIISDGKTQYILYIFRRANRYFKPLVFPKNSRFIDPIT
jgi:hypothetical protein